GGDGLGQARQAEQSVGVGGVAGGGVGPAVAAGEDQFAVLGDGQGGAGEGVPVHDLQHGGVEQLQPRAGPGLGGGGGVGGPLGLLRLGGRRCPTGQGAGLRGDRQAAQAG